MSQLSPSQTNSSCLFNLYSALFCFVLFLFSPHSFNRIDKKMSGGQSGYELSEAKAILTELKSIKKAISTGEKEKQDLMQVCNGTFC